MATDASISTLVRAAHSMYVIAGSPPRLEQRPILIRIVDPTRSARDTFPADYPVQPSNWIRPPRARSMRGWGRAQNARRRGSRIPQLHVMRQIIVI